MVVSYRMKYSEVFCIGKFEHCSSCLENHKRYDKNVNPKVLKHHWISKKETYCTLKYHRHLLFQLKVLIAYWNNDIRWKLHICFCGNTYVLNYSEKNVNEIIFMKRSSQLKNAVIDRNPNLNFIFNVWILIHYHESCYLTPCLRYTTL